MKWVKNISKAEVKIDGFVLGPLEKKLVHDDGAMAIKALAPDDIKVLAVSAEDEEAIIAAAVKGAAKEPE
jgi:hypothetical protein